MNKERYIKVARAICKSSAFPEELLSSLKKKCESMEADTKEQEKEMLLKQSQRLPA